MPAPTPARPPAPPLDQRETRVLIFGLSRCATVIEVQSLLGPCRLAHVQLVVQPGDNDEAYGVVHLPPGRVLAHRLSRQISQRSLHGRRLRAWVPVMDWS